MILRPTRSTLLYCSRFFWKYKCSPKCQLGTYVGTLRSCRWCPRGGSGWCLTKGSSRFLRFRSSEFRRNPRPCVQFAGTPPHFKSRLRCWSAAGLLLVLNERRSLQCKCCRCGARFVSDLGSRGNTNVHPSANWEPTLEPFGRVVGVLAVGL